MAEELNININLPPWAIGRWRATAQTHQLALLMKHDFIKTGDPDAHRHITDSNGEVVLSECRACGQAEGDLEEECPKLADHCSLGVGCDDVGVCFADAHGQPQFCGRAINQCDGCRVGAPFTPYGNHRYSDGSMMGCTKSRYL